MVKHYIDITIKTSTSTRTHFNCLRHSKVSIYFHTFIAYDSHDLLCSTSTTTKGSSIRRTSLKRVGLCGLSPEVLLQCLFILFFRVHRKKKKPMKGQVCSSDSLSIDVLIKHVTGTEASKKHIFHPVPYKRCVLRLVGKNYYYYFYYFFCRMAVESFVEFCPKLLSERTQSNFQLYMACTPTTGNNELMNFLNESFNLSGFQFFAKLNNAQNHLSYPLIHVRHPIYPRYYFIQYKPFIPR